jgi:Fe2+ or Zn2+ uptake regulation protein
MAPRRESRPRDTVKVSTHIHLTSLAKKAIIANEKHLQKRSRKSNLGNDLQDALRSAGRRLTPQRRLILQVLEKSNRHLDADALCKQVRMHDPDISLATVYRTLAMLREIGLIEEHRLGEGHGHYERVRDEPHYHFTCLRCGKVIEFDAPLVAQIEQKLEQEGVRIVDTHLHVSGYCAQCNEHPD